MSKGRVATGLVQIGAQKMLYTQQDTHTGLTAQVASNSCAPVLDRTRNRCPAGTRPIAP